jgi:hypothetical protein
MAAEFASPATYAGLKVALAPVRPSTAALEEHSTHELVLKEMRLTLVKEAETIRETGEHGCAHRWGWLFYWVLWLAPLRLKP